MNDFNYVAPGSLHETLALASEYSNRARVIAGGTDLLAKIKKGLPLPETLINIECLDELRYVNYFEGQGLRIGSGTTLEALQKSDLIKSKFPVFSQTISDMASPFVRRRATIGGNLCNAAPSADTAPPLIVLGARAKISSLKGERTVPVEDFFSGPGQTVLQAGEMLTEIQIDDLPERSAAVYLKQKRRSGADLAVVGVAVMLTLAKNFKIIDEVRIALGAVAPTPIRAKKAESIIRGKEINAENSLLAGQTASSESAPIDDARGSADYRKKLVTVMVKRAVQQAYESIRPGSLTTP